MRRTTAVDRRTTPSKLGRRVAECLWIAAVLLATPTGIASATPLDQAAAIAKTAPAHASAAAAPATNAPAAPVVKYRVSTSPDEPSAVPDASGLGIAPATPPGQPVPLRAQALPLTRAATRQRVESMSPTRWLMHYGDVRVHDRD